MEREEQIRLARQLLESGVLSEESAKAIKADLPELAESEDERIRKFLIDILSSGTWRKEWPFSPVDCVAYLEKQKVNTEGDFARGYNCGYECCLEWLEKQKEQKWFPSEGEMGVLYKLCYISNQITDEDDTELTRLYQDLKREYFNGHSFENMFPSEKQKEQKPAEWSEEEIVNWLKENFYVSSFDNTKIVTKFSSMDDMIKSVRKRLKALHPRPHWKPSEAQMEALERLVKYPFDNDELSLANREHLAELVSQLKKLM